MITGEKIGGTSWGFKEGPVSWVSGYRNSWNHGGGAGGSIECTSNAEGCLILQAGTYDIKCYQRAVGTGNPYVGIGLNGDRAALENRLDAMWTHSHAGAVAANFTESYFLGTLAAGDLITCGAAVATTELSFGAEGYMGVLKIIRVNESAHRRTTARPAEQTPHGEFSPWSNSETSAVGDP